MKLLVNGTVADSGQAVISALDHGFLYGMGLFETFRTYGGRPWLLERHAARLAEGCRLLGIAYEPDTVRMARDIGRVLEANGFADGYIRWSVSAGEGALGLPSSAVYDQPNVIVYAKELAADDPATRPAKTVRLLRTPRSSPEGALRLKSFHYMNNMIGKRELLAAGALPNTEGIFLNADGHVVEGLVSNIFWIGDGVLHTPALLTGPLAGVTRAFVLELAAASGIRTEQGLYGFDALARADEVFVTNSIQEIVPVTRVEDAAGNGSSPGGASGAGAATALLMRKYRAAAERNGTR